MTPVGDIPDYSASIAVGRNVILVRARAREVRGIIGVASTLVVAWCGQGQSGRVIVVTPFSTCDAMMRPVRDSYLDPLLERDFTSGAAQAGARSTRSPPSSFSSAGRQRRT